ncbi:hypothetical protein K8R47_03935 [archaeon]|nr:hypothetical protein [archaeon]
MAKYNREISQGNGKFSEIRFEGILNQSELPIIMEGTYNLDVMEYHKGIWKLESVIK